jgi:Na+-driven multidrug efflux pump
VWGFNEAGLVGLALASISLILVGLGVVLFMLDKKIKKQKEEIDS